MSGRVVTPHELEMAVELTEGALSIQTTLRPLGIQPPLHRRRLDFFRKSFRLDGSKMQRLLGFVSKVGFCEGALCTARWYEQVGWL